MSDTVLNLLADASLRVTVLAVIVASIVIALHVRTSRVRHTLWTMVLFAMLLMPVLPWWVPAIVIPFPAPSRGRAVIPGVPVVLENQIRRLTAANRRAWMEAHCRRASALTCAGSAGAPQ
jgi:hypothetical protein